MAISRKTLVDLHLTTGCFLFPVIFMFAITGGLYTYKITGAVDTKTETVTLAQPMSPDLTAMTAYAEGVIKERNLVNPRGSPGIKKMGSAWQFEWTGSHMDVVIEPTENPLEAKLVFKHATPHRYFVQLHKAKGGLPFKILAAVLAVGLCLLTISGFLMAQSPQHRRLRLYAAIAGLAAFLAAAGTS